MSRDGSDIPFDDSNTKNVIKFINNSTSINEKNFIQNNNMNNNNKIAAYNNADDKSSKYNNNYIIANKHEEIVTKVMNIAKKFENKFLVLESRSSIFYNPDNNKKTAYLNINKNDLTDLNDSRNQIIFFGIKDIYSKEYYVKPRLSTKKNINSFLNADSSFNNSKVYTEANVSDLNISANKITSSNNYNERKSIKSHSNYPEYVPEFKTYSIEKIINILYVDKNKTEAKSANKAGNEAADDFKRFRNLNIKNV